MDDDQKPMSELDMDLKIQRISRSDSERLEHIEDLLEDLISTGGRIELNSSDISCSSDSLQRIETLLADAINNPKLRYGLEDFQKNVGDFISLYEKQLGVLREIKSQIAFIHENALEVRQKIEEIRTKKNGFIIPMMLVLIFLVLLIK